MNHRRFFIFAISGLLLLQASLCPPASAEGAGAAIAKMAQDYQARIESLGQEQALSLALGQAGRTWTAVALDLAKKQGDKAAEDFIVRAGEEYKQRLANNSDEHLIQVASLNLFYKAVNAQATIVARRMKNTELQKQILGAEERILSVVTQARYGSPVWAALSGGAMTMLAVTSKSLDTQGRMSSTLEAEFKRRRQVAANISGLKDADSEERFWLLADNYIQGCFSMVEILGLILDPSQKDQLAAIEKRLIKFAHADLPNRILAGAKALAEAGFVTAPALAAFDFGSDKPDNSGKHD